MASGRGGNAVVEYSGGKSSKDVSISAGAIAVYLPASGGSAVVLAGVQVTNSAIQVAAYLTGVQVTNSAVQVTAILTGVQTTLSAIQVVDVTPSSVSKTVSQSSGTVKGSAGTLFTIFCTTGGSFDCKDGNTVNFNISTSAGAVYQFGPWGIPFATTISISASAFVGTFVYK